MYQVSKSVRATHNQDGAVVLAIHTGQVLRLNPTGSLVFQYLQQGATEAEILATLTTRFQLTSEVAAADLREFLDALERLELIHPLDFPAAVQQCKAAEALAESVNEPQSIR
ncbi:MAG TPA: PqqD family protein [Terriglobales bacterium]|nr:PqqD family protein [Terriglobales bacterium]